MTSHLDYQTQKLKRSILELVTLVEDSVQKAITASVSYTHLTLPTSDLV